MEHPDEAYVVAARVEKAVAEEARRVNIVYPYAHAVETAFDDGALYGAARDEEFLEGACVELVEAVGLAQTLLGRARDAFLVGKVEAESSHDALDERAYEVVGEGTAPAAGAEFLVVRQ